MLITPKSQVWSPVVQDDLLRSFLALLNYETMNGLDRHDPALTKRMDYMTS